jgi:ABC-2 type transport system ATP-binding protein
MISIHNLSKNFGAVQAVRQLDLTVPRGELFCFLGPNGAGKTTTIKLLCGLLKPSSGRMSIGGFNVEKNPSRVRQITGYIPDTPFLYERLTTTEFFEFIGDLYRIPPAEINSQREYYFGLFGLEEYAFSLIKDLSHGYRQRLIYASTLLHKPDVLFIDEPFIGIDPYTIRLIHDLLRQKTAEGMTVFLTSHILALIEKLADRIGIIMDGRLVALGTLDELRKQSAVPGALEDVFLRLTRTENNT